MSAASVVDEMVVDNEHMNCISTFYQDGRVKFKPCLNVVRFHTVHSYIKALVFCGVDLIKVVDYGCGDKRFLMQCLLKTPCLTDIVCVDKSLCYLVREKLLWQPDYDRRALSLRVRLIEADVLELPEPAATPHVVTLIEVIEHFCVDELPRLLWGIFGVLKPKIVVITTPNTDFNESAPLPDGKKFRHPDHKFEWSSKEFRRLCVGLTGIYADCVVTFDGCGLGKVSYTDTSLKEAWYDKKRQKGKVFAPVTKNEESIDWVLKVLKYKETMPGTSSIKAPVLPSDWSRWSSMAEELMTPRCLADEVDEPPCMKRFLTKNFVIVQDITFQNAFALFFNEMKYRIESFTWSLNPFNYHYPFADKVLKLVIKWDYLNFVEVNLTDRKYYESFLKLVSPSEAQGNMYSHDAAHYDADNDGACHSSHRNHKKCCRDCPFLYFQRVKMAQEELIPKEMTIQAWQNHVVYENPSGTKLYYSFVLLRKYLGCNSDDKLIRTALDDMKYERVFVGDKEYWSCSIGRDLNDDSSGEDDSLPPASNIFQEKDDRALIRGDIGSVSDHTFAAHVHSVVQSCLGDAPSVKPADFPSALVAALQQIFPCPTIAVTSETSD